MIRKQDKTTDEHVNTLEPRKGQRVVLSCNNTCSSGCPSVGSSVFLPKTKQAILKLEPILKQIRKRMHKEGFTIKDGEVVKIQQ